MKTSDVKKEMLRYNDGRPFISITELANMLHVGRDSARALVAGLPFIPQGRRKDYLVSDVAERLSERRRI